MSTEYQPLVASGPNTYTAQLTKSGKSLKKLGTLVVFVLLIVGGLSVYALRPSGHTPHGAGFVHNNLRRQQMEPEHPAMVPKRWTEDSECADDQEFTMTLAIKEENMDMLDEWVMEVADPKSEKFHEYWTQQQIMETFAPSQETLDAVKAWLEPHGFSVENGNLRYRAKHGNLLQMTVTCAVANEMLGATYLQWTEADTGRSHLRVKDGIYSVPAEVGDLIDWIEPSIRFPIRSHQKSMKKTDFTKEDFEGDFSAKVEFEGYNTPPRLYTLYGMDEFVTNDDLLTLVGTSGMSQGIVSFDEEYYEDTDLALAWEVTGYAFTNTLAQMHRVPKSQSQGYGSEAELDTQYVTATGMGLDTYVYYIDGTNDDYFSAMVEDALEYDDPPSVISISYGADEYEWGEDYCTRANSGFGKLSLMGTTIFASSGDDGALGDDSDCLDDYKYIASFPASATYVTAVGGTLGGNFESSLVNGTTQEIAWADSGGGFSIYFDLPSYQVDAVTNYLDSDVDIPWGHFPADARGLPDISAQAVEYIIAYESAFYTVSGTSCSSPTVAGMFSMVNVKRESQDKKKLGFLNPVLYTMYNDQGTDYDTYFNDVTHGYNEGCSDDDSIAFYAADGWDPITGCGTPKLNKIMMFMTDVVG